MRISACFLSFAVLLFAQIWSISASDHKYVNIDLKTNWPYTPLTLEISEFINQESPELFWKFVESIHVSEEDNEKKQYEQAIAKASEILSAVQFDLLQYSLSLRYFSPSVQLYRQLHSSFLEDKDVAIRAKVSACKAFVYFNNEAHCSVSQFQERISQNMEKENETFSFDHFYPSARGKGSVIVILYATIGTPEFSQFHAVLKALAEKGEIQYVFRHIVPHFPFTLGLGGYGVELALKNLEYKTVDDTKVEGSDKSNEKIEIEEQDEEINGILFGTLQKRRPKLTAELATFKSFLLSSKEQFEDLKVWDLKDLGYQASQRILSASNPLKLLREISQNFPTHATSLSKIKVNETLKSELKDQRMVEEGKSIVLINGRVIQPETVDPFSLFPIIKEEIEKLDSVMRLKITQSDAFKLLAIPSDKSEDPIFYVRSDSILFANDLEKDPQYSSWRSGVGEIFQRVWPGSFRYVARNFFTVVAFVNPETEEGGAIMHMIQTMITQSFPVRFGVVFVTEDLATFAEKQQRNDATLEVNDGLKLARGYHHLKAVYGGRVAGQMFTYYLQIQGASQDIRIKYAVESAIRGSGATIDDATSILTDTTYDEKIFAGNKFAIESGFGNTPIVFMNGVMLKSSNGREFYQEVINHYFGDTPAMQDMVKMGIVHNGVDIYEKVLDRPQVFKHYNHAVLPTEENPLNFVSMALTGNFAEILHGVNYHAAHEDTTKFVTELVAVDLTTKEGQILAYEALNQLSLQDTEQTRVGLLHNPKIDASENAGDVIVSRAIIAAHSSQISSKAKTFVMNLLSSVSKTEEPITVDFVMTEVSNSQLNVDKFKKSFDDVSTLEKIDQQRLFCRDHLGLQNGDNAVITNGRIIKLTGVRFTSRDFKFLGSFEYFNRAKKIVEPFNLVSFTASADEQTSNFVSDAFMGVASILGIDEQRGVEKYRLPGKSTFEIFNGTNSETLLVTAIIDPLSIAAQRVTPILELLVNTFDVRLQVVLNPAELSGLPLKNFYTYVLPSSVEFDESGSFKHPTATLSHLPVHRLLTLSLDVPESWLVTPITARHDLDNIKLENIGDDKVLYAEFQLQHIVLQGNCYDFTEFPSPPRGLEVVLGNGNRVITDTIVMANLGYYQLKANPGVFDLKLKTGSRSEQLYDITSGDQPTPSEKVIISDLGSRFHSLAVKKKAGKEAEQLLVDNPVQNTGNPTEGGLWDKVSGLWTKGTSTNETLHVFSLASGHLYERFLKIMMLTVVKNTHNPVKFWLLANFLSPKFKDSIPHMARKYNFQYELVTYKWPTWLNKQTEKQRIIWGYKILFLDVLFPLDLKKVVYVDADQVVKADLRELWDVDLQGAPYAYTPFCDDNHATDGFRFWNQGFWKNHLQGLRYHISALYLVDLVKFRRMAAGDQLRATYDSLSRDPNSLANLDQDLPNYLQHAIKIHSLPQEWLWCETWCGQDSKANAKTIDLCNNPLTKIPKLENALKIIPNWTDLDNEVKQVDSTVGTQPIQVGESGKNNLKNEL